jgi:ketosteroid isomerase-like protein
MKLIISLLFISLAISASAQTAEDSIKATVNKLFEGMKSADASMIKSTFADSAILQSVGTTRDGKTAVQTEKVADFADIISKLPKDAADERIQFETIKIDGALAIVWAPYKFYFKGQFSHCGADSFQLVRINGKWVIQYLIDTRRKDCN